MLALDALHAAAMDCAIKVDLLPGDLLFFNNLGMLHARDAFVDNVEVGQKRHLLRILLRNESRAWGLPGALEETWLSLYDHPTEQEAFPLKEELFTWAMSH